MKKKPKRPPGMQQQADSIRVIRWQLTVLKWWEGWGKGRAKEQNRRYG